MLFLLQEKTKTVGTWPSKCVLLEGFVLVKTGSSKYVLGLKEAEDHLPFEVIWPGNFHSELGHGMRLTCYVTEGEDCC